MKNKTMTEDEFLSALVADCHPVYCWLASGIKLEGTILGFDSEAIFMRPHTANDDLDAMMIFNAGFRAMDPPDFL
jgi:sRNA-binding regulator protein Hfq